MIPSCHQSHSRRRSNHYVALTPIILTFTSLGFNSAYAGDSYNVYNYDLTNPLFTPDGFIKQVEYASDAASQSSPMLIFPFLIPNQRNDNNWTHTHTSHKKDQKVDVPADELACIVASISDRSSSSSREYNNHAENKEEVLENNKDSNSIKANPFFQRHRRGQRRIVTIPISIQHSHPSSSTSSSQIILGLNGILPDCMELVSLARDHLVQTLFSSYGIHTLYPTSLQSMDTVGNRISSQPFMGTSCSTAFRLAQCHVDNNENIYCWIIPHNGMQ